MAFPNTCMTPGAAGPSPGPIPYPSIAMLSDGSGSKKVKIKGKEVLRKGDKINKSDGDKSGNAPGGVVSGVFSGVCEIMMGWAKVKAEGQQVGHQVSVVGQNGPGGKNIPVGIVSSVTITDVKVAVDMAAMMSDTTVILIRCDDPPAPPPPTQEELDAAKASAAAKGGAGPPAPDPATQQKIQDRYDQVMRGEAEPPPGVTREQMQAAMGGVDGQRIPMTFTPELFAQFRAELGAVLRAGGITDATVTAIGSGTSVYSANPAKNLKPWAPVGSPKPSDADFSVFSEQAVAQAESQGCAYSDKYGIYKNGAKDGKAGFSDTPVGKKLSALARRWTEILYGDAGADGVEFKLNLTTQPTVGKLDSITVVGPG